MEICPGRAKAYVASLCLVIRLAIAILVILQSIPFLFYPHLRKRIVEQAGCHASLPSKRQTHASCID
jgi:hypothetical protein